MNIFKTIFFSVFVLLSGISFSQNADFQYEREIIDIKDTWHSLSLPNEVFRKLSSNGADIRILGITSQNDTIEAPYLWQKSEEKELPANLINKGHNATGYYFTFEMPTESIVNQLFLDFEQDNFDWRVKVEGSHNQTEWFTLTDNYRILAINNANTNYKFTNIRFPNAKYRYIRVGVKSETEPILSTENKVKKETKIENPYRDYVIKDFSSKIDKATKETIIEAVLEMPVPISYLQFVVNEKIDYYRSMRIEYLRDSVKTEMGYLPQYSLIHSGTLSSLEKNEVSFEPIVCQKIKISIENRDNQPLKIEKLIAKGNPSSLIIRFTEPAKYFLFYGNKNINSPNYDISIFKDKIPADISPIKLQEEVKIAAKAIETPKPLFQNKLWLWLIMALIIIILGFFSFKMIKNK